MAGAPPSSLVEDGDVVAAGGTRLWVVWTPGHTPGHICFFDEQRGVLLAGDHVRPRISPNVSLYTTAPINPLADFLDSLQKVAQLDVAEVLPPTNTGFTGLSYRARALIHHHEPRLPRSIRCWPGVAQ